jgi:hypothetical protein
MDKDHLSIFSQQTTKGSLQVFITISQVIKEMFIKMLPPDTGVSQQLTNFIWAVSR